MVKLRVTDTAADTTADATRATAAWLRREAGARRRLAQGFRIPQPGQRVCRPDHCRPGGGAGRVTLLTGWGWGLAVIAAGFWLRVLFGPRISPLAQLSVKVLAPRLGRAKLVPGPPKRFAQGMGAAMSTAAACCSAAGLAPAAWILLAVLVLAASLEAFAGFCLGCVIFGFLQRRGLIPAEICEACNNVALNRP